VRWDAEAQSGNTGVVCGTVGWMDGWMEGRLLKPQGERPADKTPVTADTTE
jgi:hypothetical protein